MREDAELRGAADRTCYYYDRLPGLTSLEGTVASPSARSSPFATTSDAHWKATSGSIGGPPLCLLLCLHPARRSPVNRILDLMQCGLAVRLRIMITAFVEMAAVDRGDTKCHSPLGGPSLPWKGLQLFFSPSVAVDASL